MAFPPSRSISLITDAAASAPLEYVMATFAPSMARRLAMAAPIPREPPVMSAIFPSSFLFMACLLFLSRLDFIVYRLVYNSALDKTCQVIYLPIGMKSETPAQLGRPRSFDPDTALY